MMGGFEPVVHLSRSLYWNKSNSWEDGSTYHEATWPLEPFFLWVGAFFLCRELDPIFPATEAGKIVKLFLKFVKSVLNLGLKDERKNDDDTRNTGLSFVNKIVYTVLCVVATLSLIELLRFSHSKLDMGRVLVLVLLMLVVNEIFAKFRAIAIIRATGHML